MKILHHVANLRLQNPILFIWVAYTKNPECKFLALHIALTPILHDFHIWNLGTLGTHP
jgi:hypothetical protein